MLVSGGGSNFRAIDGAIREGRLPGVEIAVVLSDVIDSVGLASAREMGYEAAAVPVRGRKRAEHDADMVAGLHGSGVDLVCLAGYMRLLSPVFVGEFPERILNIHPSLLPAFPGLHAQRQAWEYGVAVAGCTVHFVDEQLDHGPIVLQRSVPVMGDDTEESLRARILVEEHIAYPEAIARVASGEYEVRGRRYVRRS